ncbi:hypothetical protein R1flu_024467 [Riccia fluitans]|uniref:Uncharacterized protein n=1 Tax=Riccia fluitans TaxID=41844 RepID=A0ABD1XVE7_9MARC
MGLKCRTDGAHIRLGRSPARPGPQPSLATAHPSQVALCTLAQPCRVTCHDREPSRQAMLRSLRALQACRLSACMADVATVA